MARRDRRLLTTRLAKDVPAGQQGQPEHKAGDELVHITAVQVEDVGGVSFATPRASELILQEAKASLKRAARLRAKCLSQVRKIRWTQPGIKYRLSNDQLVFDFFGAAMSGIVDAYTAVDARLNEYFTTSITHEGQEVSTAQVQGYWSASKKLTVVVAETEYDWLADEALVARLAELKELRDIVSHVRSEHLRAGHPEFLEDGSRNLLWSRLLNDSDLERFGRLAEKLLDGLRRPTAPDSGESQVVE